MKSRADKKARARLFSLGILLLSVASVSTLMLSSCGPSKPPEVSAEQNQTQNETKSEIQIRAEELLAKAQKLKKEAEDKGAPQNERAKPFYQNGDANLTAGKAKMEEKDYLNAIPPLETSIKNFQTAIEAVEFNEDEFNKNLEEARKNLEAIRKALKENDMTWPKTAELENAIHRAEYLYKNNEFANAQKQARDAYNLSEDMKAQLPELIKMANEAKDLMAQVQNKYSQNKDDLEKFVPDYAQKVRNALGEAHSYYKQAEYDKSINKAKEADSLLNLALEKLEVAKADYAKVLENLNQTRTNIDTAISRYNANETMPELLQQAEDAYQNAKSKLGSSLDEALTASNDALALSEKLLKEAKDYWFQAHYYVVKKGDCLWNIAKELYGDPLKWKAIYRLNKRKIRNPHWIYPRQVFRLPWPPRYLKKPEIEEANVTEEQTQPSVEEAPAPAIEKAPVEEKASETETATQEQPQVEEAPEVKAESQVNKTITVQEAPQANATQEQEAVEQMIQEAENATMETTPAETPQGGETGPSANQTTNQTEESPSLEINIEEGQ